MPQYELKIKINPGQSMILSGKTDDVRMATISYRALLDKNFKPTIIKDGSVITESILFDDFSDYKLPAAD